MIKNYTCTILPVCVNKNCHFENKYLVEHKVYSVKHMFRENWYTRTKKRLTVMKKINMGFDIHLHWHCIDCFFYCSIEALQTPLLYSKFHL